MGPVMSSFPQSGVVALLPESQPPWKEFIYPEVLVPLPRDYHFIRLVATPPPVNQQPAPTRLLEKQLVVAQSETPIEDTLHIPADLPKPKNNVDLIAPRIEIAEANALPLPPTTLVVPRQPVRTNVFSPGSSATPTVARAPQLVQTGGFGDPNGVPAQPKNGRPVTIAQAGSFALPSGPGYGNGTGGAHGVPGVVASAGFGNGVATGDGKGRVSASRVQVREAGFGGADASTLQPHSKSVAQTAPRIFPAEIVFKPLPTYTAEARKLRLEGEVLLEVVFGASGQLRVVRVVQGLGHGLDDAAIQAAERIRFKPALRDGQPTDFTAVLHVIFQLA
ncbi:MAG: hypothetical protein DMG75_04915 [Acidobacteria bacterium]|nr:MAG: hypothetical protein DMG75_04915 [Acidobacteriota bacterium]